jgi:hypothetical protein
MPFEAHIERILLPLAGPIGTFRSALAATVEQVRGFLESHRLRDAGAPERPFLGAFAEGRIDFDAFSSLVRRDPAPEPAAIARMEKAFLLLKELEARGTEPFVSSVEPGTGLRDAAARALGQVGRAFGAARVFELSRSGRYREAEHGTFLESFPFERWSRAERAIAPPIVLRVPPRDLRAEGLAEFLDGALKIVLYAPGEPATAPLVRLVTPGTFVLQTKDGDGLDRLAAFDGPGIAAWIPEGAALFVHDPSRGSDPAERLSIGHLPEPSPLARAGRSAFQQAEELRQLAALAARSPGPVPRAPSASPDRAAAPAGEPVDRLAAWLLAQADLHRVP